MELAMDGNYSTIGIQLLLTQRRSQDFGGGGHPADVTRYI